MDHVRRWAPRHDADFEDADPIWVMPPKGAPEMEPDERALTLRGIAGFVAYGREIGQPGNNPFRCG